VEKQTSVRVVEFVEREFVSLDLGDTDSPQLVDSPQSEPKMQQKRRFE
jgi:hypothetical protein